MDRAWIARKQVPDVEVYGGLVLNPQMGGLNPYAVETAIKMGAKIIWLPTSWSAHERSLQGKNDGVACIEGNKVLPVLVSIFKQLAANDIALATGHLSSKECLIVVEEAKKQGSRKLLLITRNGHQLACQSLPRKNSCNLMCFLNVVMHVISMGLMKEFSAQPGSHARNRF